MSGVVVVSSDPYPEFNPWRYPGTQSSSWRDPVLTKVSSLLTALAAEVVQHWLLKLRNLDLLRARSHSKKTIAASTFSVTARSGACG
jgi:hypothetical protein